MFGWVPKWALPSQLRDHLQVNLIIQSDGELLYEVLHRVTSVS